MNQATQATQATPATQATQARQARRAAQITQATQAGLPCREYEQDLWFAESPGELELAKALCGACPVRDACLAGALERREPWGVWGGELFERGQVVARKRPRGRPRKVATAA